MNLLLQFALFAVVGILPSYPILESIFSSRLSHDSRIDHELAWFAPFYSGGGYCSEARAYMEALHSLGYQNFSIHQHGDSWNQNFIKGQNRKENELISSYDNTYHQRLGSALINICHSEPGAWYVPKPNYQTFPCPECENCYKIGRTMFETDSIPSGWIPRLNSMNEIWVPTTQSKEIFIQAGVATHKLRVLEETVNTNFYCRKSQPERLLKKKKYRLTDRYPTLMTINRNQTFIFLFIGKFEDRKGIDLLIRAYFEEFSSVNDNVMLLLLTSAYHSSNDFRQKVFDIHTKYGLDPNFAPPYLILSDIHQDAMPILYSLAHALVIPSHGEGWGRPHMEAMACELPVLATDWSGPTAFMNNEIAYMIPIKGLVDSPNWKGHKWADIDFSALKQLMRHVYSHPEEAQSKGQQARQHIINHFSYSVIGNKLLAEILRIKEIMASEKTTSHEDL